MINIERFINHLLTVPNFKGTIKIKYMDGNYYQ